MSSLSSPIYQLLHSSPSLNFDSDTCTLFSAIPIYNTLLENNVHAKNLRNPRPTHRRSGMHHARVTHTRSRESTKNLVHSGFLGQTNNIPLLSLSFSRSLSARFSRVPSSSYSARTQSGHRHRRIIHASERVHTTHMYSARLAPARSAIPGGGPCHRRAAESGNFGAPLSLSSGRQPASQSTSSNRVHRV